MPGDDRSHRDPLPFRRRRESMSTMGKVSGRLAKPAIILTAVCAVVVLIAGMITWQHGGKYGFASSAFLAPRAEESSDAATVYQAGRWERAADLARRALKSAPDDRELLRIYARASARLERDQVAATVYRERIGNTNLDAEDSFLVGLLYARAGKLLEAWQIWDKAIKKDSDRPELLDNYARLSGRLQRLDEAAEAARRLARLPGSQARGLFILADIEQLLGNPKGASDALRVGLEQDPIAKDAFFPLSHYRRLMGRALLQLGKPGESLAPLEQVTSAAPSPASEGGPEAYWLLSRAYLQLGRKDDAILARGKAGSYREENPLMPEPGPYLGAAACAACHAKESQAHAATRHARTFHHAEGLLNLPLPDHPLTDPDLPAVTHVFERDDGRIRVKTRNAGRVYETIVAYAFGVPDRYVTMVGRDQDKTYRALRLSSYTTKSGVAWGPTAGDVPENDAHESVRGQPMELRDGVVRCLYCHVTQSRDFRDPPPEPRPGPEAADKGIGCERCHGPGANHVAAVKRGFPDPAIVNTGNAPASAIVTQCADCHIVGVTGEILAAPENPLYVRSPGVTLTVSRCYTESGDVMSCLTCHDPHRDDDQPVSFYEAKCLGCHSAQSASQKHCRVNPTRDCLTCHMPKVPVAALHTSLTDHYIRIHRERSSAR